MECNSWRQCNNCNVMNIKVAILTNINELETLRIFISSKR